MKKISFLMLILLFLQGYAQNTVKKLTYHVNVLNLDGQAFTNATIVYQNMKDKSLVDGVTDEQGKLSIQLIQGQSYFLTIKKDGVEYKMQNVNVPMGNYADASMTYTIVPPQKGIVPKETNSTTTQKTNSPPIQKTAPVTPKEEQEKFTSFVEVTNFDGIPEANAVVVYENVKDKKILKGQANAEGKIEFQLVQGQTYLPKIYQYDTVFVMEKFEVPVGNFAGIEMNYQIKFVQTYKEIYQLNIHFNTNDYSLGVSATKELDVLVDKLKANTQKIELAAHTDDVGSDAANMLLSQNRANSVRNYLIEKGIDANRLIAKGYGETKPISDNTTDKGRAMNRRTEVRVISEK